VSVRYLDLVNYLAIAAEVTGLDEDSLSRVARLHLADSALHAPAAGWGDDDLYPDFVDKAAVLVVRLTMNHPLPDGNKRAAWVTLRVFIEVNQWRWVCYPPVDESERAMIAVASGEWDESHMASWLRPHLVPDVPSAG
jgi:death-on-curing protein